MSVHDDSERRARTYERTNGIDANAVLLDLRDTLQGAVESMVPEQPSYALVKVLLMILNRHYKD